MEQFIGCDPHKKFSVFVAVNEKGQAGEALRVVHDRQVYRELLARLPPRSAIAVEASGSYSWLVDEMERSGHYPRLCNPFEAKRRMGLHYAIHRATRPEAAKDLSGAQSEIRNRMYHGRFLICRRSTRAQLASASQESWQEGDKSRGLGASPQFNILPSDPYPGQPIHNRCSPCFHSHSGEQFFAARCMM